MPVCVVVLIVVVRVLVVRRLIFWVDWFLMCATGSACTLWLPVPVAREIFKLILVELEQYSKV